MPATPLKSRRSALPSRLVCALSGFGSKLPRAPSTIAVSIGLKMYFAKMPTAFPSPPAELKPGWSVTRKPTRRKSHFGFVSLCNEAARMVCFGPKSPATTPAGFVPNVSYPETTISGKCTRPSTPPRAMPVASSSD